MSAFVHTYRARFGVEPICQVLGGSASAYSGIQGAKRARQAVAHDQESEADPVTS